VRRLVVAFLLAFLGSTVAWAIILWLSTAPVELGTLGWAAGYGFVTALIFVAVRAAAAFVRRFVKLS
jgi:hypothetical protein